MVKWKEMKISFHRSGFLVLGAGLFLFSQTGSLVHAMDRDVRTVLLSGVYGAVGGTAVGVASYPFHQSVRGIFMGSSIGLYVGVIAGWYLTQNWNQFDGMVSDERSIREPLWMKASEDHPEFKRLKEVERNGGAPPPVLSFKFNL